MGSIEKGPDLVQRAIGGDIVALKLLLTDCRASLCARLARRIPDVLRGTVDADDVVQETHVEVFRRIRTFAPRGPDGFERWLHAIAVSRLRNAIKRQRTLRRGGGRVVLGASAKRVEESSIALLEAIAGSEHTPSRTAERAELVQVLQDALGRLPARYRQAVQLVHVEGRPVKQAAALMHRTERAVHGLCRRGIRLLQAQLRSASRFLPSER